MSKSWFLHEIDYSRIPPRDNGYWEIRGNKPEPNTIIQIYNIIGGHHDYKVTELDEFIYSDWETVARRRYTENQKSDYGWIDLEGNFYGCDWSEHRDCADICFGLTELDAERQGYVKIYYDKSNAKYDNYHYRPDGLGWYCDRPLTDAQITKLNERGFSANREREDLSYDDGWDD